MSLLFSAETHRPSCKKMAHGSNSSSSRWETWYGTGSGPSLRDSHNQSFHGGGETRSTANYFVSFPRHVHSTVGLTFVTLLSALHRLESLKNKSILRPHESARISRSEPEQSGCDPGPD